MCVTTETYRKELYKFCLLVVGLSLSSSSTLRSYFAYLRSNFTPNYHLVRRRRPENRPNITLIKVSVMLVIKASRSASLSGKASVSMVTSFSCWELRNTISQQWLSPLANFSIHRDLFCKLQEKPNFFDDIDGFAALKDNIIDLIYKKISKIQIFSFSTVTNSTSPIFWVASRHWI